MNFERSPFFMPWEPRNVRRVRSVSFETLILQRTACSSIFVHLYAQVDKHLYIHCRQERAKSQTGALSISNGNLGVLRDLDTPADGLFFHFCAPIRSS